MFQGIQHWTFMAAELNASQSNYTIIKPQRHCKGTAHILEQLIWYFSAFWKHALCLRSFLSRDGGAADIALDATCSFQLCVALWREKTCKQVGPPLHGSVSDRGVRNAAGDDQHLTGQGVLDFRSCEKLCSLSSSLLHSVPNIKCNFSMRKSSKEPDDTSPRHKTWVLNPWASAFQCTNPAAPLTASTCAPRNFLHLPLRWNALMNFQH